MNDAQLCHYDEIWVDSPEEQEKRPILSTNQSNWKLMKILGSVSLKKIVGRIIRWIIINIFACEISSFGLKYFLTISEETDSYPYQILGSSLMIGIGFLSYVLNIMELTDPMMDTFTAKIHKPIVRYCKKYNYQSSHPWWQRIWFVKFVLIISIVSIWLLIFEIGYWLGVIVYLTKNEPIWNRPHLYGMAVSTVFFGYTILFGIMCGIMIEECFFE